jgi:hypothetical protein
VIPAAAESSAENLQRALHQIDEEPSELSEVMAGYQVQRGRPPVITPDVVRHPMRDSDTLSGTSAAEEP